MGDALGAHLAGLPEAFLARIARRVLHVVPGSRPLAERALAQRLMDVKWISHSLGKLGPRALAALRALGDANGPVLRSDLHSLAVGAESDVLEELEELGLIAPVRTGRGMPTHVAITPGIEGRVRDASRAGQQERGPAAPTGAALAGARQRFELALLLGAVAQHPPRITKEGRLHAGDLGSLANALHGIGATSRGVDRRLTRLAELGVMAPEDGHLAPTAIAFEDVPRLWLLLVTSELAQPSLPRAVLAIVDRLLAQPSLPLPAVLHELQAAMLVERAGAVEPVRRGAKGELAEALFALLALDAVVVLDDEGHPALLAGDALLARVAGGAALSIALEPAAAAFLRADAFELPAAARGHVQSSFEVVADPSCDPTLVARIGRAARLERADLAAVLKLERRSIEAARARGARLAEIRADLEQLAGRPVPANVATVLQDWYGDELSLTNIRKPRVPTPEEARIEAWRALDEARAAR